MDQYNNSAFTLEIIHIDRCMKQEFAHSNIMPFISVYVLCINNRSSARTSQGRNLKVNL